MSIEAKNSEKFSRRVFLGGLAASAVELVLPKKIVAQESNFIPSWVLERCSHLKLEENGLMMEKISRNFNIDPQILLAILIMESPNEISTSYAGAQGAFQIMPETRRELIRTIENSGRLQNKIKSLEITNNDLLSPSIFKGEVFLTCTYLEDERVKLPKGEVLAFSNGYFSKLHQVKMSAIKYHDGPNCDPSKPSDYGKIAGERVSEIFQLLKGTKGINEVAPEVAEFLNL